MSLAQAASGGKVVDATAGPRASIFRQTLLLLQRVSRTHWRDTKYNIPRFMVFLIMYTIFGVLFRELKRNDFAGMQVQRSCVGLA